MGQFQKNWCGFKCAFELLMPLLDVGLEFVFQKNLFHRELFGLNIRDQGEHPVARWFDWKMVSKQDLLTQWEQHIMDNVVLSLLKASSIGELDTSQIKNLRELAHDFSRVLAKRIVDKRDGKKW